MTEILDWTHKVVDVPAKGLERKREATAAEREALAKALQLLALHKLDVNYRITAIAGGGYRLAGRLFADLAQACVVSLEPVPARLNEDFEVEFWQGESEDSKSDASDDQDDDIRVLDGPEVDRIVQDTLPVGRIVYETLAAGLDPYPRKDGATFDWQDQGPENTEKVSPFEVLKRLKDQD